MSCSCFWPLPCPRLTVLQRGCAVEAAPAQDVPSLLAGFLPLLLLCGTKAQCGGATNPSTPSPAPARQGVGCGHPQEAGGRSLAGRKETLGISFNPHKPLWDKRQLFPFFLRGGGESLRLRKVKEPVQSHKSGR